jgi:hypothetical protein
MAVQKATALFMASSLGRLWFAGEALSEKYFGVWFVVRGDAAMGPVDDACRVLAWGHFEGEATGAEVA